MTATATEGASSTHPGADTGMGAPGDRSSHRRPDIQGLRGVAVLLVVLFHAGGVVPGGFVGVDVFFVISGFVITLALHRELRETGSIHLPTFYARRARRLLPPLALVIVTVLVVATWQLDFAGGRQVLARTARAASLFVANRHLESAGDGYFSADAEDNALLHMWSLSIEEQFYLVLPGLLLGAWLLGRRAGPLGSLRRMRLVVGTIALASFAGAVTTVGAGDVGAAFYRTPLRAWEFALGALLALSAERLEALPPGVRHVLGTAGVVVVGWVAVTYTGTTEFPGLSAVAPVLGTCLLIAAGPSSTSGARWLSSRSLVWIGDRSYSWYLWHWPAIVFAVATWGSSITVGLAAALVALVPAAVSHSVLEQPLRTNRRMVGLAAATLALIVVTLPVAGSVLAETSADTELAIEAPELVVTLESKVDRCGTIPWRADLCVAGPPGARGTIALLGDSHAIALQDVVTAAAADLGYRTATFSRAGCPATTMATTNNDGCRIWAEELTSLVAEIEPDAIVVVNRSPAYVFARGENVGKMIAPDGTVAQDRPTAYELWDRGLRELLAPFDVPVQIVRTVPEFPNGRLDQLIGTDVGDAVPALPLADREARTAPVAEIEARIAADRPNTLVSDPASVLCPGGTCVSRANGQWLYVDDDHLSSVGSSLLHGLLRTDLDRLLTGQVAGPA
jgi:peptidoglycan/LPS O-acetylase OafA/YrhL